MVARQYSRWAMTFSAAIVSVAVSAIASASENADWSATECFVDSQQDLFVVSESVEGVFSQLAEACGAGLKSRIRKKDSVDRERLQGSPADIVAQLANERQLNWSFDGLTLHVIEKARAKTRLLPAHNGQFANLEADLRNLGWRFSDDSIVATDDGRLLKLSGTEDFLAFTELVHASDPAQTRGSVSVYKSGRKTR